MKLKFTFLLLLLSSLSFAQLTTASRGRVFNSENKQLTVEEVRNLLSTNVPMLDLYDAGRAKKTAGNILLIGGAAAIVADLATGFTQDKQYPTALTFVGATALIVAIPVKIGYSRKIRKAISGYNEKPVSQNLSFNDLRICAAPHGLGLRLKF
jgi:hypothetical protein